MLEATKVSAGYPGRAVLADVHLELGSGEVVALLGVNGAGKSTLLKAIAGVLKIGPGRIVVDGEKATRWSAEIAVRTGVVLVPEGRHIFPDLCVQDNLLLGAYSLRKKKEVVRERLETVLELFPALGARLGFYAGLLSGGQQQMLAIGRGLMGAPRYLLLDEPSLGLAPGLVSEIFSQISQMAVMGIGILVAEQNVRASIEVSERVYLLERGQVVREGPTADFKDDRDVADQLLGIGTDRSAEERVVELGQRIVEALGIVPSGPGSGSWASPERSRGLGTRVLDPIRGFGRRGHDRCE